MKAAILVALGTCLGALGAWVFPTEAPMSGPMHGADRGSVSPSRDSVVEPGVGDRDLRADSSLDADVDGTPLGSLRRLGEMAPRDAFSEALALPEGGPRTRALIQVARVWARRAPREVLAEGRALPEELRGLVESAVAEEWAIVDPAGFLAYAEEAVSIDEIVDGLKVLLATDPETIWAIADRHAGAANDAVDDLYLSAVRAMAGRDPAGTIARLQAFATGQRRDLILSSIAEGYADRDPEAALNWVLSIQPLSADAAGTVIRKIAVEDPLRAYEVVRGSGSQLTIESLRWMLSTAVLESRQDPASIATALVQRYERDFSDPLVSALLNQWVQRAPDDAMTWLSANRASVTAEAVTIMVSSLAFDDVQLAVSLFERVPSEFEFQWLQETAKRYGQFEPDEAIDWIAQFETRPDYGELLDQIVLYGEPRFATGLVESSDHAIGSAYISLAANMFAEQDPRAAAEWALRLTDDSRSDAALEGVTTGWLRTDPAAVQRWALDLPRGESRDEIIETLFEQGTSFPLDVELLIEGFSSEAAADRLIREYVERVTRQPAFYRDAGIARAEQMIDLATDPSLRRQAEERLAEAR